MSAGEALARARSRLADGDLRAAQAAIEPLLRLAPDADVLTLHARLCRLRGDLDGASSALVAAREAARDHVEATLESAELARDLRELERAVELLNEILVRDPGHAKAQFELGRIYRMRGEYDEAFVHLRAAVASDPALADAHNEIGWILWLRDRLDAALESYERALELDPGSRVVQQNLGLVLGRLERYERAREILEKLCAQLPITHTGAWLNLAVALSAQGETSRAREIYDRILEVEPAHIAARWNRSHFLLAERDFGHGWRDYEWRFLSETLGAPRLIPFPSWQGEPLQGRTLAVSAEQGLGDQIMFASCVPELVARAGRVILECEKRLEPLFRRSFPSVEVVTGSADVAPGWVPAAGAVDYHAPMGSLPRWMRSRAEDFPRHEGYLRADPVRVRHWRQRLDALGPGRKIGLSWRGGTHATRQRLRTLRLDELHPLAASPGCTFVSLQYGDCEAERLAFRHAHGLDLHHWPEAIADYDETAALCSALDLTISVCTAVIHLNGALGRPVWVLVPSAPEWRYGFRGRDMPWYPSVTLYRQATPASWAPVIEAVRKDLDRLPW